MQEEFTNRDTGKPLQIGIEFELSSELNVELREKLKSEAPHLEQTIAEIASENTVSFIVAGSIFQGSGYLFLQQIGIGHLEEKNGRLTVSGINVLGTSEAVSAELFQNYTTICALKEDLEGVQRLGEGDNIDYLMRRKEDPRMFRMEINRRVSLRRSIITRLESRAISAGSAEELRTALSEVAADIKNEVESLERVETKGQMLGFAGPTRMPPGYVHWLATRYGRRTVVHLRETKEPIGRGEANLLLQLKVRRGRTGKIEFSAANDPRPSRRAC